MVGDALTGKRLVGANAQIAQWKGPLGAVTSVAMTPDGRMAISGGADTSLIVWDVTGHSPQGRLNPMNLGPNELQNGWNDLSSEETPRGNRALWEMVAGAKDSVPSLDRSVFLLDPDHVNKLLKDLDDKIYRVRENAETVWAYYRISFKLY